MLGRAAMLGRAQNTFHHNPRLRGPVSSIIDLQGQALVLLKVYNHMTD